MTYPSRLRWVIPDNPKFRVATDSQLEYLLLGILVMIMLSIFNINHGGGFITQFNRLIASPAGVEQLYNEHGEHNLLVVEIKGVRASDRAHVQGDYLIIKQQGKDFLVESKEEKIYKVGTEPDSQIITESMKASLAQAAVTKIEPMQLQDEEIEKTLAKFQQSGTIVFVSGHLKIDYPDEINFLPDPEQFPYIRANNNEITLESAPLDKVVSTLGNQFAKGFLVIRRIYTSSTNVSNSPT